MIKECFGVLINEPEVLIILSLLDLLFLSTDLANVPLFYLTPFSLYLSLFLAFYPLSPHSSSFLPMSWHWKNCRTTGCFQWSRGRERRTEDSVAASSVSKLAYLVFLCAPNIHTHITWGGHPAWCCALFCNCFERGQWLGESERERDRASRR